MFSNKIVSIVVVTSALLAQTPIAVLDFSADGISSSEVRTLTNRFRSELFKTGMYKVIERELMEEILIEQGFQQSGCTTTECIVEVGKLIGVQKIVAGGVGLLGRTYTISIRVIDVESAEIINSNDYDYKGEIDYLLTDGMKQIINKLFYNDIYSNDKNPVINKYPENLLQNKKVYSKNKFSWENTYININYGFGMINEDRIVNGYDFVLGYPLTINNSVEFSLSLYKGEVQYTPALSDLYFRNMSIALGKKKVKYIDYSLGIGYSEVSMNQWESYIRRGSIRLKLGLEIPIQSVRIGISSIAYYGGNIESEDAELSIDSNGGRYKYLLTGFLTIYISVGRN